MSDVVQFINTHSPDDTAKVIAILETALKRLKAGKITPNTCVLVMADIDNYEYDLKTLEMLGILTAAKQGLLENSGYLSTPGP